MAANAKQVRRAKAKRADKVLIYKAEAERLAQLTSQYPATETGGDLFGYWTHGGTPIVTFVIGPGQASRHNRASFYQDVDYLHDIGTELYDAHGLQHIGEWHSHHNLGLNEPSAGDVNTVVSGMRSKGWNKFLLMIATFDEEQPTRVVENFYMFSGEGVRPRPVRPVLLPGASPVRQLAGEAPDQREETWRWRGCDWRPGPNTPAVVSTRRVQPANEIFRGAWFVADKGKALLSAIVRDFADAEIACRVRPNREQRGLSLVLPKGSLHLPDGFPSNAPVYEPDDPSERAPAFPVWEASSRLVDWYSEASRPPEPPTKPPEAKHSERSVRAAVLSIMIMGGLASISLWALQPVQSPHASETLLPVARPERLQAAPASTSEAHYPVDASEYQPDACSADGDWTMFGAFADEARADLLLCPPNEPLPAHSGSY